MQASERIMVLSIIVMAAHHLQSVPYFPIMIVVLFVTIATGFWVKKFRICFTPLDLLLLDKYFLPY